MDFVQVMKDWRRMCKAYSTDDDSCCDGCPVVDFSEHGCGAIFEMKDGADWQKYADAIAAWAKDNPEPQYPTWGEWLLEQGVLVADSTHQSMKYWYSVNHPKIMSRIPDDIAQKLGIEPKEG